MGGIAVKNFRMFKKLCGEPALENVVIVTNRWREVKAGVGEAREAELMREEKFYAPVLRKKARMARHVDPARMDRHIDNALSAEETIVFLLENTLENPLKNTPLPLHIQDELVNQHKKITDTDAAEELDRVLKEQIKKHEREKKELVEAMEQAAKDKDEETRKELEIETKRMEKEIEKFQNDSKRLESDYEKEREKINTRIREVEGTAQRELAQHQEVDELNNISRINAAASDFRGSDNDNWVTIPIYE